MNSGVPVDGENAEDVTQNGSDTDSVNFTDLDGTLVGETLFNAGQNKVVIMDQNKPYLTEGETCQQMPEWNMNVCTGQFFRVW